MRPHRFLKSAPLWVCACLLLASVTQLPAQSPADIAGYLLRGTITTGPEAGNSFAVSLRSDAGYQSGDGGGTYTYTKPTATTAQLVLTSTFPEDEAGDVDTVTMTFQTATNGTFLDRFVYADGETGSVNGTFNLSKLPPLITALAIQPKGILTEGGSATINVSALATGNPTHQWFRDGVAIDGARSPVLELVNITPQAEGRYHVIVTDAHGSTRSRDDYPLVIVLPANPPGFVGGDDFNDNARDSIRWGVSDFAPAEALAERNTRLEYVSATTNLVQGHRVWHRGLARVHQDWEARVHVNLPDLPFTSEGLVALRIMAVPADDTSRALSLELEAGRSASGASYRSFLSVVDADGNGLDRSSATTTTSATLRLRWDSARAMFHAEYDPDGPANGDAWQTLRTYAPEAWNLNSTSPFLVSVGGLSEGTVVTSTDEVWLDTFETRIPPPQITSSLISTGMVATPFQYQIVATGEPTSFGVAGLPEGLTFSSAAGLISGTPTSPFTGTVPLSATNEGGTGTATLTLNIRQQLPRFTSAINATAQLDQPFSFQVAATGNPTNYSSFFIPETGRSDNRFLPPGLSLDTSSGLISGVPVFVGTVNVSLWAFNATGSSTTNLAILVVPPPPVLSGAASAEGTMKQPFRYQPAGSWHFSTRFSSSTLPDGLSIDPLSGLVSGTPASAGSHSITIQATNTGGSATMALQLKIDSNENSLFMLGSLILANHDTGFLASGVSKAAGGIYHILFVKEDGRMYAMGSNEYGQLGDGTTENRRHPVLIDNEVSAVAAGGQHSLFLKRNGTLWGMGYNGSTQLGNTGTRTNPDPVLIASDVASIGAGRDHTLYIKTDHTLWALGRNDRGQLGTGSFGDQSTAIQVTDQVEAATGGTFHTLFLKRDKTLSGMGSSGYLGVSQFPLERSTPIEIASGVSSFSASGNHSVFVRNGFLMGMGSNVSGQLGPISTNHVQTPIVIESGVINAVAGNSHTLFTRLGRELWGLGHNTSLQLGPNAPQTSRITTPVRIDQRVSQVAAGNSHSLYIVGSTGQGPVPGTPPRISIENLNGELRLTWPTGTLESAPSITGPWTPQPQASSPQTVAPVGPAEFFRVR
jgi:alpha-tubulin suppressor-like RCC1 family protein